MGKPGQRTVDILGLQHQSGRCCGRASGGARNEAISQRRAAKVLREVASWWQDRYCGLACPGLNDRLLLPTEREHSVTSRHHMAGECARQALLREIRR